MRLTLSAALIALLSLGLPACGGGNDEANHGDQSAPVRATKEVRCDVGERPRYFVPISPENSPLAIIGCARLGASDKGVEFSANTERIAHESHLCLNPAYRGRGQLGIYIPTSCALNPVPRRLTVFGVEVPRQAVRDYQLVIWGTSAASTEEVIARYPSDQAAAAMFTVNPPLARKVGAERPFSAFVVELPAGVTCEGIMLRAHGPTSATNDRFTLTPERVNEEQSVPKDKPCESG